MSIKKKMHEFGSILGTHTHVRDGLGNDQRRHGWEDGVLYLLLDDTDPVVRAHGVYRLAIEDKTIWSAFDDGFCTQRNERLNRGMTHGEVTVVANEGTVRIVAKLINNSRQPTPAIVAEVAGEVTKINRDAIEVTAGGTVQSHPLNQRSSSFYIQPVVEIGQMVKKGAVLAQPLTDGKTSITTTIVELNRLMGVKKDCLQAAGLTYKTLRSAIFRGDAVEIDAVQRGLSNRQWQLGVIGRCKNEGLRDALNELIAINDMFFENVAGVKDLAQALEMVRTHIEGNVSLNEEIGAKVQAERERLAAEKDRKSRSIATVADMLEAKERAEQLRSELRAKRDRRLLADTALTAKSAADKLIAGLGLDQDDGEPAENDEFPAGSADDESSETDAGETEGYTEVPPTVKDSEPPRLNARAKRMFENKQNETVETPAPEAPQPAVTAAKKVEADIKPKTFAEKLAAHKATMTIAADSAPTDDSSPAKDE